MSKGAVNKVILVGNVGQIDARNHQGNAITNLTLATNESWKDKSSGQMQERTEWHRVVLFNKLAEIAGQYVKKGSKIYIEGSLRTRKYQKDGRDVYTTEIVASDMQMLDGPRSDRSDDGASRSAPAGRGEPEPAFGGGGFPDDDIPF